MFKNSFEFLNFSYTFKESMGNVKKIFTYFISVCFIVFSFCIISSVNLHALIEIVRSPEELAISSTDVVVAKCVKSEVKKDENTGFIFTYLTFKVAESLKGQYKDEVVLRVIGGTIDNITIVSSGQGLKFKQDEEFVLFLGPKDEDGYPVLQSILKGIYKVGVDSSGQKIIISNSLGNLNIAKLQISQSPAGKSNRDQSHKTEVVYLEDFINAIKQSFTTQND